MQQPLNRGPFGERLSHKGKALCGVTNRPGARRSRRHRSQSERLASTEATEFIKPPAVCLVAGHK